MASPRAPWWMYIVAASFIGNFALSTYVFLRGPESPLSRYNYRSGAMVVEEVLPNSPASRAGLRVGDRILAFDGVASMGIDVTKLSDADVAKLAEERARRFLEDAPTSAAEAAKIILDGVKADRWRILVGHDAELIDKRVREAPESAYDVDFFQAFAKEAGWKVGT